MLNIAQYALAMATIIGFTSAALSGATSEEPDTMEILVSSYTEVLLIGYACKDYGASGHHAIVERTINDFIELGMSLKSAVETIDGLIATEGPYLLEIIHDEAQRTPQGAVLYCTTAYPAAVSKLDQARIAIARVLQESQQEKEQEN